MGLENVPRCQHVKVNGVQCSSPALRQKCHCYFHERVQHERKRAAEDKSAPRNFGFPVLEDANSIQVALMKIVQLLGSGCLDPKTAGLMLYALQTASANLRHAKFEPEEPTDVIIDEDTVDLTHLAGPQWSSRDFTKEERERQKDEVDTVVPVPETGRSPVAVEALDDVAKRREQKRKLRACSKEDEGDPLAKYILDRVDPGWQDRAAESEAGNPTGTPS